MNILLPTDFSKCATYAYDIACQLASKNGWHLHLYHCADIPEDWENLDLKTKVEDKFNKYVIIEVREKLMTLKEKALALGIQCTFHYTGGNFLESIVKIFQKENIDLVIMGSHGAAGKQEWFIGSNTQKIVRKFRKNLLVVKEEAPSFTPQSAVFVTGLNTDDQIAFKSFLSYVDTLEINEVHVLTIDTSAWFTQPTFVMLEAQKDFKKIASEYNCQTHFYQDHSIQSGIRHFIIEHDIELIGISYRERHPIKRIFLGSNVEMLINHTNLPVLCIND